MITALENILGQYVQLQGDGIASLNLEWIVCAIVLLMSVWVSFRIILKFMDWLIK